MAYNGLPFDDSLLKNLEAVRDRIKLNKASMIVLDGGVGEGKTTFAVHIAKYYQPNFMERCQELLTMGGKQFLKGLDSAVKNKDKVIIYDEAGDFSSRGALTWFNQNLNRVFETYRQTGIIIILCLPFFADIDSSLFKKSIPRVLIHCYGRNMKYGRYKVYSLWRTWYLRTALKKLTVPQECYRQVQPNQHGQYKDLDEKDRETIAKISIKGKRKIIQEAFLTQKGMVSVERISRETGYSKNTLYQRLKDEESEKVGVKKYYNKELIPIILNEKRLK